MQLLEIVPLAIGHLNGAKWCFSRLSLSLRPFLVNKTISGQHQDRVHGRRLPSLHELFLRPFCLT